MAPHTCRNPNRQRRQKAVAKGQLKWAPQKADICLGFSRDHCTLYRLHNAITSAENKANSNPILSFSLVCRMKCLALLKTVHGVPKWTTDMRPLTGSKLE